MISKKDIINIRKIYITKSNLNDFPKLKERLFYKYYPNLKFQDFRNSDIWFSCVWNDYCSDLFGDERMEVCEGDLILFSDAPGPVG